MDHVLTTDRRRTAWGGRLALLLLLWLATAACRAPRQTNTTPAYAFKDDLSPYRPTPPAVADPATAPSAEVGERVAPTHQVNRQVDALMEEVHARNAGIRYAQGYRVQIYTGAGRNEAAQAKERAYQVFPALNVYTTYQQPTFRVKTGDFLDRLEAQQALARLKATFPSALLVSEQVNLPQSAP